MALDLLPAPPRGDGTRLDWGIVSTADPLTFSVNGVGEAVDVARRAEGSSTVDSGDKILVLRTAYGGWVYLDRLVDAGVRPTPDTPITPLQPTPTDPATGLPTAPVAPPIDPATGLQAIINRLRGLSSVRIVQIVAPTLDEEGTGTVRWVFAGHPAGASDPAATGFDVVVRQVVGGGGTANDRVSNRDTATATERSKSAGRLAGGRRYYAQVRATTTLEAASTVYSGPQVASLLAANQQRLSDYYSVWVTSPIVQIPQAPINPVIPPHNVRWDIGTARHDKLGIRWDYQPFARSPTATGFQAKVCKNSLGTVSCSTRNVTDPTVRNALLDRLDDDENYWGFVRTVAGNRTSRWIPVGPPKKTAKDYTPEFRNFVLRVSAPPNDGDLFWSVEIRNATEFKVTTTFQPQRVVEGTMVDAGQAYNEEDRDWVPLSRIGSPDRMGWYTVTPTSFTSTLPNPGNLVMPDGRVRNANAGVGIYTVSVEARNPQDRAKTAKSLSIRRPPLFISQNLYQLGNRVNHTLVQGVLLAPLARGIWWGSKAATAVSKHVVGAVNMILRSAVSGFTRGYRITPGRLWTSAKWAYYTAKPQAQTSAVAGANAVWTSGGGRGLVSTMFSGIRIDVETSYYGWETLEWEVSHRPPLASGYNAPDWTGTETNDFRYGPGQVFVWSQQIPLVDLRDILNAKYYTPGSDIRLRTRATNSAGTTPWHSTVFSPNEFDLFGDSTGEAVPEPE